MRTIIQKRSFVIGRMIIVFYCFAPSAFSGTISQDECARMLSTLGGRIADALVKIDAEIASLVSLTDQQKELINKGQLTLQEADATGLQKWCREYQAKLLTSERGNLKAALHYYNQIATKPGDYCISVELVMEQVYFLRRVKHNDLRWSDGEPLRIYELRLHMQPIDQSKLAEQQRKQEAASGLANDVNDIFNELGWDKSVDSSNGSKYALPEEPVLNDFVIPPTPDELSGRLLTDEEYNPDEPNTGFLDDKSAINDPALWETPVKSSPVEWKEGMEVPAGWKKVPNNVTVVTDEHHIQMMDGDRVQKINCVIVKNWVVVPSDWSLNERKAVRGSLSDPQMLPGAGSIRYSEDFQYDYNQTSGLSEARGLTWEAIKAMIKGEFESDVEVFENLEEYERWRRGNGKRD